MALLTDQAAYLNLLGPAMLNADRFPIVVAQRLPSDMSYDSLTKVLDHIWKKHDALRLIFKHDETGWDQVVLPPSHQFQLYRVSLRDFEPSEHESALKRVAHEAASMIRVDKSVVAFMLIEDLGPGQNEKCLLIAIHHLACDRQSVSVLCADIEAAGEQVMKAEEPATKVAYPYLRAVDAITSYAHSPELHKELDLWQNLAWAECAPLPQADLSRTPLLLPRRLRTSETMPKASEIRRAAFRGVIASVGYGLTRYFGADVAVELVHNGRTLLRGEPGTGAGDAPRRPVFPASVINTIGWFSLSGTVIIPVSHDRSRLQNIDSSLNAMPNMGAGYSILRHLGCPGEFQQALISRGYVPAVHINYRQGSDNGGRRYTEPFQWRIIGGTSLIDCSFKTAPLAISITENTAHRIVDISWDPNLHAQDAGSEILQMLRDTPSG
jgi:hypothetical protein